MKLGTDVIQTTKAHANLDAFYGPYNSIQEVYTSIPIRYRMQGLTVGVKEAGGVVEYWWRSSVEDGDLVKKVEQLTLSLQAVGEQSFTKEEEDIISAQFIVDGGAGIKKAMLYQIVGDNEIFVQEYNNVGKKSAYTFIIPNPSMSGVYHYRIKVLDSLDNYAITASNTNYIEYTLHYGGISTVYNITELNSIKVKNYTSIAEAPFKLNISVRDNTFRISSVCLTDSTDESPSGISIELTPSTGSHLGNNTYYMPNSTILEQFNGKRCSITVNYVEGETVRQSVKDLFKLLDIGTLDIVPEYEGGDYYATLPGYYTFQLYSGVENISVILTPGENSDFNFESSTVLAYRRFSLRIIPKNIVKNNAQIVINYYYKYNNIEYTGSFTRTIGNIIELPEQSYYEPALGSTVTRETLIYSDENDYSGNEDAQYYKVISEPVSINNCLSSSFILDTYCKINQQNDKTIKYIKVTYGGVEIASVTEDEISCATQWSSLYTDTPINEWTQIGIGINLQETFQRNNEDITGYYHCIYINGMLVKSVLIDNSSIKPLAYNSNSRLSVTIGEGILVQKCFLYYRNDGQNIISPNTQQNTSIIYNNYKSHKLNFEEPQDLPVLKFLRINNAEESERYFELINNYKREHDEDLIVHTTKFGTIGSTKAIDMSTYDPYYSSSTIESNATLFRQNVEIKKPAQKEYAVLCKVQWMGNELQNIIVEVHTQGTSTLVYSIPNFKFTFWRLLGNSVEKYYPEFIKKEDSDEYYQESVYTAKADYMDSSHLNNTPTCNYYNSLIQRLIIDNSIEGSPSARNGMLDAILGFPIVMEISDTAVDFNDIFINIGSFMLNIDKTGSSLGFEVDDDGNHLSCISFEGTSNDNNSGASGRFDIPEGTTLKSYINQAGEINETEIRNDYDIAKNQAKGKGLEQEVNGVLVKNLPYVKWCIFLSEGLEYRYPDADMYKLKNNTLNKVMDVDHFIALYKMWSWVNMSDTLTQEQYKAQFPTHFDLNYCMLYFINLMIYAQTDNLGKNAMFDCWDGEHWYPRPYDLDSECGLDNNGNDNIAPFVEIRPSFSLNYDIEKANDYAWLSENYLLDETVIDQNSGITYQPSTIQYGARMYDRYHFSSNKSKLWINFYKNYKTEIENFYSNLRNHYNYNADSIINSCKTNLIDKLGVAQYNQDFQNKYLANADQRLAYGNRWYKFKKWLNKRFAFCDSYFSATESAQYNLTKRINYEIKVDAPQYISQQYQGSRQTQFVLEKATFSAGSGAATIITLLVNQPSVFETSLFKNVVYNQGSTNYNNLIRLDVSGNNENGFTSINSVVGTELNNLKYLNVSNSKVQNVLAPANLKTLIADNVNLNSLVIPDNCSVETISLRDSTILGDVDFSMLPNLKRLDLTNCTFSQKVVFANLPKLEELIMTKAVFEDTITINDGVNITAFDFSNLSINEISFSGSNLQIDTINFYKTNFGKSTLNLNAICQNLRNIYFDGCTGLSYIEITNQGKFNNLNCFSISGSSIVSLGSNNDKFDCSHFNNMGNLKKINSYTDNEHITYTSFNFYNTRIQQIINIQWNGSGSSLFRDCQSLTSITGTLNLVNSADYMFYRCYALTTIPTINIDDNVTSATYIFAGCNALSYENAKSVIIKCKNVTNFSNAFQMKLFNQNQSISLDELFAQNNIVTNVNSMFSQYNGGSPFISITNKIVITGKIPSTVTTATWMFYGLSVSIPYDIISSSTSLQNTSVMFAYSNVTFTGSNRPVQVDHNSVQVTLTNAIKNDFLCKSLENIAQMFFNSNVITTDPQLFAGITGLKNTNSTFGASYTKAFTFKNSQNQDEIVSLNVSNMWQDNAQIEDISGCFAGIYSVYCTSLNFNSNITSNRIINISGLFGLFDNSHRTEYPITIDLDSITPKLITDGYYAIPSNGNWSGGAGTFANRSVTVVSSSNSEIFSKLTGQCRRMFNGTILYLQDTVLTINLNNVTDCSSMFEGCRLYTSSGEQNHTYIVQDRKFVEVTLPSGCSTYTNMFYNSSVLKRLPALRSNSATTLIRMYSGCVINTGDLELPSNYFSICSSQLSNVESMFENNQYITTLQYSADRGLFEGCTNLSNVKNMFRNANFLHKGIPVNLFGSTELPRLTSLCNMFAYTSIFYDVEDDSKKWIDSNTITPLTNLDDISGMLYRIKIHSGLNQFVSQYSNTIKQQVKDGARDVSVIAGDTFTTKTIRDIRSLFNHTPINPPEGFRFVGFEQGTEAFYGSSVSKIDENFVDDIYVSSIINADRMFYQPVTGGRYNQSITNLSIFVNKIQIYPNTSKYNIAGNVVDSNIAEQYKEAINNESNTLYYGFGLQSPVDPEAWSGQVSGLGAVYGRYIYS